MLDSTCGIVEEQMDCLCSACPFGMKVGFAYYCTAGIAGLCKLFDCFGQCNGDGSVIPPPLPPNDLMGPINNEDVNNSVPPWLLIHFSPPPPPKENEIVPGDNDPPTAQVDNNNNSNNSLRDNNDPNNTPG